MKTQGIVLFRKVPGKAVVTGGVFLLAAVLYAGLVMYPSYRSFSLTQQDIAEKMQARENQKQLFPVFSRAKQMNLQGVDPGLPLPDTTSLPRGELISATTVLSRMARDNNLVISDNTIHINGVTDQSRSIAMTIQLKGGLTEFRSYLIDIMAMESFNTMDGLHIYTDKSNTKHYTLDIRLWLEAQTP